MDFESNEWPLGNVELIDDQTKSKDEKRVSTAQRATNFWQRKRSKERLKRKANKKNISCDTEKELDSNSKTDKRYMWRGKTLNEIEFFLPHIVIDMQFQGKLPDKEVASVGNQILHAYGYNRRAIKSVFFHITNFEDVILNYVSRNEGFENWKIFYHKEHFIELFDKKELIYLTPDSPHLLTELKDNKVYIIGGISDNSNAMKNLSYETAVLSGVETARLPTELIQGTRKSVLNINHVFEALVNVVNGDDWKTALERAIPTRYKSNTVPFDLTQYK